jgi:hypothetical protein
MRETAEKTADNRVLVTCTSPDCKGSSKAPVFLELMIVARAWQSDALGARFTKIRVLPDMTVDSQSARGSLRPTRG